MSTPIISLTQRGDILADCRIKMYACYLKQIPDYGLHVTIDFTWKIHVDKLIAEKEIIF